MNLATLVYTKLISSTGVRNKGWRYLRKALLKVCNDPECSMTVHGRQLRLPLSHLLPIFVKSFPFYDSLPHRISEHLHNRGEHLNCIDVGANIGDTIAAFYRDDADKFLAIEPNPNFNRLLVENWGWNKNVTLVSEICSSGRDQGKFSLQERNGTASVVENESGVRMTKRPLDEMVKDCPFAAEVNVLKIDTDGHDLKVIAGARETLARSQPALLFECDDFENPNYVEECLDTLKALKDCGYKEFLVYSNTGYLMGKYSLADLTPFRSLLFYQLVSDACYFDILLMKSGDLDSFYKTEVEFFADKVPVQSMRKTALAAMLAQP